MDIPERGDIYYIDVAKSEAIGHEFWGKHWYVVLSPSKLNAALKIFTAIPLTSVVNKVGGEEKDYGDFRYFRTRILHPHKKPEPGQSAAVFSGDSIALPEQMRTFALERITAPRVGIVESQALGAIESGILFMIGSGIHRQAISAEPHSVATPAPSRIASPLPPPQQNPRPGQPIHLKKT